MSGEIGRGSGGGLVKSGVNTKFSKRNHPSFKFADQRDEVTKCVENKNEKLHVSASHSLIAKCLKDLILKTLFLHFLSS